MNGQGSISLREGISPVRVSAAGTLSTGEKYFFVYGLKTRIRKGDEVCTFAPSFRFAGQIYPRTYHQAQSWKKTISGFAFKSEVTKAKEVSVGSRML